MSECCRTSAASDKWCVGLREFQLKGSRQYLNTLKEACCCREQVQLKIRLHNCVGTDAHFWSSCFAKKIVLYRAPRVDITEYRFIYWKYDFNYTAHTCSHSIFFNSQRGLMDWGLLDSPTFVGPTLHWSDSLTSVVRHFNIPTLQ